MSMRKLVNLFVDREHRQRPSRRVPLVELTGLELLDRRILPAVSATFSAVSGALTVSVTDDTGGGGVIILGAPTTTGDASVNTVTISRDAAGTIFVNNGEVPIVGDTPTVANTGLITVFGGPLTATSSHSTKPTAPCRRRSSSAVPATTPSSAVPATTRSTAAKATTS